MTDLAKEKPQEYPSGTPPLSDNEAALLAGQVPGWRLERQSLVRDFEFHNFQEAFAFLARVALLAEANSHHPDIHNSWNKVTLRFFTHTADGLTRNDFIMAAKSIASPADAPLSTSRSYVRYPLPSAESSLELVRGVPAPATVTRP
jgi:4a-hydroxytetrahydrobiopterin dehydratase